MSLRRLEYYAMDGATATTLVFQTPARILIPKLVASRDGWKAKAGERKKRLKAACIRIRDLVNSRDGWKAKADAAVRAAQRIAELERQLEQTRQDLAAANAANAESKKKERPGS